MSIEILIQDGPILGSDTATLCLAGFFGNMFIAGGTSINGKLGCHGRLTNERTRLVLYSQHHPHPGSLSSSQTTPELSV